MALGLSLLLSPPPEIAAAPYPNAHLLVDADALAARIGDPRTRIVDLNTREVYRRGHVPGAVHLDLEEIRATVNGVTGQLAPVPALEKVLGSLGVTRDTEVIGYDDRGGLDAARLFFTLETLGHEKVRILDGGAAAWQASGRALTTDQPRIVPATYRATPRPEIIVDKAGVLARLGRPDVILVDSRSPAEYQGTEVRAKRGGRIPGAVNVPWDWTVLPSAPRRWKSADEVRAIFERAGVRPDKEIIPYCQTFHRGAHTYVTLRLLGYSRLLAYVGSWEEWGNDPAVPVER